MVFLEKVLRSGLFIDFYRNCGGGSIKVGLFKRKITYKPKTVLPALDAAITYSFLSIRLLFNLLSIINIVNQFR